MEAGLSDRVWGCPRLTPAEVFPHPSNVKRNPLSFLWCGVAMPRATIQKGS